MIAVFKKKSFLSARLCSCYNLAFFVSTIFFSCNSKDEPAIRIVWIDNKAAAVYLPTHLLKEIPGDSLHQFLRISLADDKSATAILGDFKIENNIVFEPLVPFTAGSSYHVFYGNKIIGSFLIPAANTTESPQLIACYPQQDTLPENLLKLYLAFSHPMREGQSEKYIALLKSNSDTLKDEFLNLQPELWNEDRTVLTIWLDPGRIKRDLQPNLLLGAPLKKFEKYTLIISKNWQDAKGMPMQNDFTRSFTTGTRDSLSPNTDHWKLILPPGNSREALTIIADEVLDHFLFAECLQLKGEDGIVVKGKFEIDPDDKSCRFFPELKWMQGTYSLVVESRLEDLAGNNLNRPFDRDITRSKEPLTKPLYEVRFNINSNP